jgi:hypothetical protein
VSEFLSNEMFVNELKALDRVNYRKIKIQIMGIVTIFIVDLVHLHLNYLFKIDEGSQS